MSIDRDSKVSVTALHLLPYTILIKAVAGVTLLIHAIGALFAALSHGTESGLANLICMTGQGICFIGGIICIVCLLNISPLAKEFAIAARLLVATLIAGCVVIVLNFTAIYITASNTADGAENLVKGMTWVAIGAYRILVGTAVLMMMKGLAGALRDAEENRPADNFFRYGPIYICIAALGTAGGMITDMLGAYVTEWTLTSAMTLALTVLECAIFVISRRYVALLWQNIRSGMVTRS